MSALKIVVFVGSARDNRLGTRVLRFVMDRLKTSEHNVTVFDPLEMQFDVLKQPFHFYKDPTQAPQWLQDAAKVVVDADCYLVISPEYNATIPPALSNMMDHFAPSSYAYKPTGICTYSPGIFGGIRCSVALRAFLNELGSFPVPSGFTIPNLPQNIDEDGKPLSERMETNYSKLINNLVWYAEAVKAQRASKGKP